MALSKRKKVYILIAVIAVLASIVTIISISRGKDAAEVSTYKIERKPILTQIVSASGEVRPVQFINLTSDVPGRIEEIFVEEGDAVSKGTPLVRIDPSQIDSSRDAQSAAYNASLFDAQSARSLVAEAEQNLGSQIANINAAKIQISTAETELADARRRLREETELFESGFSSRSAFEDARVRVKIAEDNLAIRKSNVADAEERLKAQRLAIERLKTSVRSSEKRAEQQQAFLRGQEIQKQKTIPTAPISGVIADIISEVGQFATAGLSTTALLTIADMSTINIEVKIDETEIDKVLEGQPATIEVDAFNKVKLKGKVKRKTPLALGKSQTSGGLSSNINIQEAKEFRVVIELIEIPEEIRNGLRPGMSATAEITTNTVRNVIAIPLQSLVKKATEGVYVIEDGRAKFIAVKTGLNGEFDIEVKSGLKEGMIVITGPNQVLAELSDGAKVKAEDPKARGKTS